MAHRYLHEVLGPATAAAQEHYYRRSLAVPPTGERDALGPTEAGFIARRDSFYLATVGANGWPYVQHRGGPIGFLKVLDPHRLAFPDFRGNRQLVSTGNLAGNDRVSLLLMDYPRRERLKILGHARVLDAGADPALAAALAGEPGPGRKVERLLVVDVVGFDWNCPAYITPRFTEAEVEAYVAALRRRIDELEAALAASR